MFHQMFAGVQTLSNTIEQGVQTGKCLVSKQSLPFMFDPQSFPVSKGLNYISIISQFLS